MLPILNRKVSGIPEGAAYVGRPTMFGNPFPIGRDGYRDQVIGLYRTYFHDRITSDPAFRKAIEELRNVTALVCWCAPKKCHAEVIAEWLDGVSNES